MRRTGTPNAFPNVTGWCCGRSRTRPRAFRRCYRGRWIGSRPPPPDAIPQIKAAGMQVVTKVYPHIWPYMLNHQPDSPFHDVRLRKAANLAIDRGAVVKLVNGIAQPAKGIVVPEHPWFGKPTFDIKYDPDAARKLMADAGFGPRNKAKIKFLMSTAGSGQMQPLSMNELIQGICRTSASMSASKPSIGKRCARAAWPGRKRRRTRASRASTTAGPSKSRSLL